MCTVKAFVHTMVLALGWARRVKDAWTESNLATAHDSRRRMSDKGCSHAGRELDNWIAKITDRTYMAKTDYLYDLMHYGNPYGTQEVCKIAAEDIELFSALQKECSTNKEINRQVTEHREFDEQHCLDPAWVPDGCSRADMVLEVDWTKHNNGKFYEYFSDLYTRTQHGEEDATREFCKLLEEEAALLRAGQQECSTNSRLNQHLTHTQTVQREMCGRLSFGVGAWLVSDGSDKTHDGSEDSVHVEGGVELAQQA